MRINGVASTGEVDFNNCFLFDKRIVLTTGSNLYNYAVKLFSDKVFNLKSNYYKDRFTAFLNILSNLFISAASEKMIILSRSKDYYLLPSMYGLSHFSYSFIVPTIDMMVQDGYLTQFLGFYDKNKKEGMRTRICPNFDCTQFLSLPLATQLLHYNVPILLKDASKRLIPYQTEVMRQGIEVLNAYNELLAAHRIMLKINSKSDRVMVDKSGISDGYTADALFGGRPRSLSIYDIIATERIGQSDSMISEYSSIEKFTTTSRPASLPLLGNSGDASTIMKLLDCRLHRVFNNSSFTNGGRFYGAQYQQLNEHDRKKILINENPTVEIDFKGLHLNILYNLQGENYNSDPYLFLRKHTQLRPLLKLIALVVINASSNKSALGALNFELNRNFSLKKLLNESGYSLKELLKKFEEAHSKISNYFNSGKGLILQNIDSRIAEDILRHFTIREIPCLCVHDSFIVEEQYTDELAETMITTYKKHLGFPGKIKYHH